MPGLDRSNFVDVLRIGSTIDVFKRVVYIYGCDEATRTFFAEVGAPQTENQEPPKDIYTEKKVSSRAELLKRDEARWNGMELFPDRSNVCMCPA